VKSMVREPGGLTNANIRQMNGLGPFRQLAAAVVAVTAVSLSMLSNASACGLEPTVKGGFSVSYPGALDVAVAVSNARRAGLLPQADSAAAPNEVRLREMLADLKQLQSRLSAGRVAVREDSVVPFSLVLVGPGLWSHFHLTPEGTLAKYHVKGPMAGEVVLLTHHSVLRALLQGTLSTQEAAQLGLVTIAGGGADSVRAVFESGFVPKT